MAATSHLRRYGRHLIAALIVIAAIVVVTPDVALANIAELSASVAGPTPNETPGGSSTSVVINFAVSGDVGLITVGANLNTDPGFGWESLDSASPDLTDCQLTDSEIVCDWDATVASGTQTMMATIAVAPDAEPHSGGQIEAFAWSDTEESEVYATSWIEAALPAGSTGLSGSVVTTGGAPVPQACIFVLSSSSYVFGAVADAAGEWSLTGLPDDWSFVIAAIGPFTGDYGPCANDGPPPVPGDGDLQPVFYNNIWADLADPLLIQGNPYDFAVNEGATPIADSATGLVSCLTTASGATIPRPSCSPPETTTTSSTTSTVAPTTSTPTDGGVAGVTSTSIADTLPVTGASTTAVGIVGALLLLLGLAMLRATRSHVGYAHQD